MFAFIAPGWKPTTVTVHATNYLSSTDRKPDRPFSGDDSKRTTDFSSACRNADNNPSPYQSPRLLLATPFSNHFYAAASSIPSRILIAVGDKESIASSAHWRHETSILYRSGKKYLWAWTEAHGDFREVRSVRTSAALQHQRRRIIRVDFCNRSRTTSGIGRLGRHQLYMSAKETAVILSRGDRHQYRSSSR